MNATTPTRRILGFIHHLRDSGFSIGIEETLDALDVVASDHWPSVERARHTLRCLTCQCVEDWQRFDDLFSAFFYPQSQEPDLSPAAHIDPRLRRRGLVGLASSSDDESMSCGLSGSGAGAGRQMTITRADYRFLNDRKAMAQAERMAERLASVIRQRPSRKYQADRLGNRLDLRRTWRKNLSSGGLPIRPVMTKRQTQPGHLLVLHDISHSMSWHNPLLYRFVRGLVRSLKTCEAFAFHTSLFRVTDLYREPSVSMLREKLEARENLWMGGTCIAESIRNYLTHWAPTVSSRHNVTLIISDGFDTDTPQELADALALLRTQSGKIAWLNPMLAREGYKGDHSSMLSAMPFLDLLAPAHSLEALSRVASFVHDALRSNVHQPERLPTSHKHSQHA